MATRITRTITTARAYTWGLTGKNDDGSPKFERSGNVLFTAISPNKQAAFRALKDSGVKCKKDFCDFEVVSETVYACSLEEFLSVAHPVQRDDNGYVREIAGTEESEDSVA